MALRRKGWLLRNIAHATGDKQEQGGQRPGEDSHRQARPRPEGDVTKAPMTEAELRRLAEEKGYRLGKRYELWTDDVTCQKVSVPAPFGTPESLFGPSLHDIEEFLKAAAPRRQRW